MYIYRANDDEQLLVGRFDGARVGDGFERIPRIYRSPKVIAGAGDRISIFVGSGQAISPLSHGFQRLLQSFAPATHAKLFRLSSGTGPLGRWAGLYAESRSRGTEEIGLSPQRLRAVGTPLAVDCGSCVIPSPGLIPTFVPKPSAYSQVSP
jgi:hypothetical protein